MNMVTKELLGNLPLILSIGNKVGYKALAILRSYSSAPSTSLPPHTHTFAGLSPSTSSYCPFFFARWTTFQTMVWATCGLHFNSLEV